MGDLIGDVLKDKVEISPMPSPEVQNLHVSQCMFPASQRLLKPNTAPTPTFSSFQIPASASEPILPTLQLILEMHWWSFLASFSQSPTSFPSKCEGPGVSNDAWHHAIGFGFYFLYPMLMLYTFQYILSKVYNRC